MDQGFGLSATLGVAGFPSAEAYKVGEFGAGDVFDGNRYAHTPREDFLNGAAADTAPFD